jgi:signal transduction histidine kinase
VEPALRERIFEPFFTTLQGQAGAGLGLSLASKFISELGGSIACEPAQGGGARLVIRLPEVATDPR